MLGGEERAQVRGSRFNRLTARGECERNQHLAWQRRPVLGTYRVNKTKTKPRELGAGAEKPLGDNSGPHRPFRQEWKIPLSCIS